jgi:hypothetical protein
MPLTWLSLYNCNKLRDLDSLKGMPLQYLDITNCSDITDLSPLEGMKLQAITLTPTNFTKEKIGVLRRIASLKSVHVGDDKWPPAEFWKKYDAGDFNK